MRLGPAFLLLLLGVPLLGVGAGAQTAKSAAAVPAIKVASLRLVCANKGRGGGCNPNAIAPPIYDPARFVCQFCTVREMISLASGVLLNQVVGGPGWIDRDEYRMEIATTAPTTRKQMMGMLAITLTKAFAVSDRLDDQPSPEYRLIVGKNGPKFDRASAASPETLADFRDGDRKFSSVRQLVNVLNSIYYNHVRAVRYPVEDGTGLTGTFAITLKTGAQSLSSTDVLKLIEKQLGLVVVVVPGHSEYVRVDSAQYRFDPWTYP